MKALIVGGTGFLGHHLVFELLNLGHRVRILQRPGRPSPYLPLEKIEVAVGDLDDADSLIAAAKGCEVIFHAAGYYPVYSLGKRAQIQRALQQTQNLLNACEKAGDVRLIYTSSLGTLAPPADDPNRPSNEEDRLPLKKATATYHRIKILMEQRIEDWAKNKGDAVILIPGGMLGPYDVKPTTGRVVLEVAKKAMPAYVNGKTSWVDVRDVAKAEIRAAEKAARGERFVLGHWNTTTRDFLEIVAQIAGVPRPIFPIPFSVAYPAAYLSEFWGKFVARSRAPLLPLVSLDLIRYGVHLDSRKARALLKFSPGPFTVTIKETLDWFRANGYLKH